MTNLHLFDIEGTIAPVDYVHKVMFPYSVARFKSFLSKEIPDQSAMTALMAENAADFQNSLYPDKLSGQSDPEEIAAYLSFLVAADRKSGALKTIQGKIWKNGFESGELVAVIYPDTVDYFKFLQDRKCTIMIYSSGSIEAQQLYLKYSDRGDLSPFIQGNFDTSTGPKKETASYQKIRQTTGNPANITFYTDITAEVDAALQAGFKVYLVDRNGNFTHNLPYTVIESFLPLL